MECCANYGSSRLNMELEGNFRERMVCQEYSKLNMELEGGVLGILLGDWIYRRCLEFLYFSSNRHSFSEGLIICT